MTDDKGKLFSESYPGTYIIEIGETPGFKTFLLRKTITLLPETLVADKVFKGQGYR